jgi:tetratricopeptide (TPR) repeat protein
MKSRLLARLEEDARTSADRVSWARSVCRAASQFARQGLTTEASIAIDSVRRTFGVGLDPEVASWLMLAEGIMHFAAGDHRAALDRIRRAEGLAVALNTTPAKATCAAWLAHIEFNLSNFDSMIPLLCRALKEAAPGDHQALGRASLVMADAYHYAGSFSQARPWYDAARLHATSEGDEAMIGAMLHNVAAFRAVNVLLANALGECLPEEAQRAKMEATSAASYDTAVGTRSFDSLTALLSGQLLIVEGKNQEAQERLSSVDLAALPERLWPVLHADIAWCANILGDTERSKAHCREALTAMKTQMDDDDAAYAWSRLASLYGTFGDSVASDEMAKKARAAMERLRELRCSLKQRLDACAASLSDDAQQKSPA